MDWKRTCFWLRAKATRLKRKAADRAEAEVACRMP
jgi:hypothetical protein